MGQMTEISATKISQWKKQVGNYKKQPACE